MRQEHANLLLIAGSCVVAALWVILVPDSTGAAVRNASGGGVGLDHAAPPDLLEFKARQIRIIEDAHQIHTRRLEQMKVFGRNENSEDDPLDLAETRLRVDEYLSPVLVDGTLVFSPTIIPTGVLVQDVLDVNAQAWIELDYDYVVAFSAWSRSNDTGGPSRSDINRFRGSLLCAGVVGHLESLFIEVLCARRGNNLSSDEYETVWKQPLQDFLETDSSAEHPYESDLEYGPEAVHVRYFREKSFEGLAISIHRAFLVLVDASTGHLLWTHNESTISDGALGGRIIDSESRDGGDKVTAIELSEMLSFDKRSSGSARPIAPEQVWMPMEEFQHLLLGAKQPRSPPDPEFLWTTHKASILNLLPLAWRGHVQLSLAHFGKEAFSPRRSEAAAGLGPDVLLHATEDGQYVFDLESGRLLTFLPFAHSRSTYFDTSHDGSIERISVSFGTPCVLTEMVCHHSLAECFPSMQVPVPCGTDHHIRHNPEAGSAGAALHMSATDSILQGLASGVSILPPLPFVLRHPKKAGKRASDLAVLVVLSNAHVVCLRVEDWSVMWSRQLADYHAWDPHVERDAQVLFIDSEISGPESAFFDCTQRQSERPDMAVVHTARSVFVLDLANGAVVREVALDPMSVLFTCPMAVDLNSDGRVDHLLFQEIDSIILTLDLNVDSKQSSCLAGMNCGAGVLLPLYASAKYVHGNLMPRLRRPILTCALIVAFVALACFAWLEQQHSLYNSSFKPVGPDGRQRNKGARQL
ncbi:hypothetical protein FVE85_0744 [Porphyridium purpureum]|uniref:Uncharacterized protein n=1 Tax=Porphyridium purpureum TaxID=35688 RepID=A0A5J4Z0V0_PORPP|nr:hypothetical protein FVE85_0744 [Porphyridium purpureum]|eukprot:POR3238..scf208_2